MVEKKRWGEVNGKEGFLFTLQNKKGTRLIVSNFGAAAVSLWTSDRNGNFADILLGYSSLEGYVNDEAYMGTIVGRYANRIANGKVQINGSAYQLHTRRGSYHLHGGEIGFNKKCFDVTVKEEEGMACIEFFYLSKHLEEGFPGNLQVRVTYTLDNENNWKVEYHCISDKDTLLNLTQHAYFNLAGHNQGTILDQELKISSKYYLPVNVMQVPIGQLQAVDNTPFDFTSFKTIGRDIHTDNEQLRLSYGYDHSWVLKKQASPQLKEAASLYEKKSGRLLNVLTTEPAVHFYSGNFLQDVAGKENVRYHKHAGLCLETQHYPDAPNHPHFPTTVLKADTPFYSQTVFNFSTV